MVEIKNLFFTYGQENAFTLSIKELSIQKGEQCCLIGPSGSGKTTLIKLIAGIYKPDKGKISISNIEINYCNEKIMREFRLKNIGLVFQDFCLLDYCDVNDNILLPFYLSKNLKINARINEHIQTLLEIFHISDKKHTSVLHLSQGEKQRVAIARALITRSQVLLCDEATGNLDPETAHSVLEHILSVSDHFTTTLLFITHNMGFTDHFSRIIDMKELN